MAEDLTPEARDKLLVDLVRSCTDLDDNDICILLEASHSLPYISNLEGGDTYINVLTKNGESMVVAQYRHPYCDLYQRNIIGEIETKVDEPAVYRALEYGLSSRGLIGIIDKGSIMVRHTVTPIHNERRKVIGALTHEYPSSHNVDTEPVRIKDTPGGKSVYLNGQIDKIVFYMQDGLMVFNQGGTCTFANARMEEVYRELGYGETVVGRKYDELQLVDTSLSDVVMGRSVIRGKVCLGDYIFEESLSTLWEDGICEGIVAILQDQTKVQQMENEIAYRIAAVNEVHHRVKNNLQTIISLVGLEAAQTKNEEVKTFSKTIISRVRSISVTHDLLAHTGTDSVNLKTMLMRVVDGSLETNSVGQCHIRADISGDDLELTASVATTVALIVNELVQNSIKYAFGGCEGGEIALDIEKGEQYSWITVKDNGCGFDQESVKKAGGGLGLKLVNSLVKSSLKGNITVTSSNQGTSTRFSFRNGMKK